MALHVLLGPELIERAMLLAQAHNQLHRARKVRDLVLERQSLEADCISALGCMAAAEAFGMTWAPKPGAADFQEVEGLRIRATPYVDGGLRVRGQWDEDNSLLVLVRGDGAYYEVFRPVRAGKCKRPQYLQRPGRYRETWYLVPADDLGGL